MNTMETLTTRIGKKSVAIDKDKTKVSNLKDQINVYSKAVIRTEADIEQKQQELDLLLDLKVEADGLLKERDALQAYTDALVEKFGSIPWRPGQPEDEKIESTDYAEKVAERFEINARLAEIETAANKIYYRR